MNIHLARHLPSFIIVLATMLLLAYGPIPQLPNYHAFSDHSTLIGIPHAGDVLSNLGFAIVALWGWIRLINSQRSPRLNPAWPGYALFLIALFLTAIGSSYYHLSPDNDRLLWDRLPIALACAGILAAVRKETMPGVKVNRDIALLGGFAVISVLWWYFTDRYGTGDLRPYLALQAMPLVLIPLWQAIYRAPRSDRIAFGIAIALYALAKVMEVNDDLIHAALGWVSGHTLKHLLATAAAAVIVCHVVTREKGACHFPEKPPQSAKNTCAT